jgi:precorrin-6B C5,15-methyltransferase / cobalt-precorrin-6B C5,C15-methyltransferase
LIACSNKRQLEPGSWQPPLLVLIGMGMGKDDLGGRALRWIERAEILAGHKRFLEYFAEHPGRKMLFQSPLEDTLPHLEQMSRSYRTVVLASGDPLFFGVGRRLVELIGRDRVLVLPNITTVQALFAHLAEPWNGVRVHSLHGREEREWLRDLHQYSKLVLFTDPEHNPAWIARRLLDAGFDDRYLVVAQDLGLATECVDAVSLEDALERTFSPLNLVAVLQRDGFEAGRTGEDQGGGSVVLGLPDESFGHQAGLITKMEIRAVVLANLQLQPDLILWDLGAGSGSVAIEAARLAPLRQVLAVEKDAARFRDLSSNVKRFQCGEVVAIHGSAPDALQGLPDPDRVFIGGSGGHLQAILQAVTARLRPHGRVVQTAVTLATLEQAHAFWREKSFQINITQLQVSRSAPIENSLRLAALNPVFVITAWR